MTNIGGWALCIYLGAGQSNIHGIQHKRSMPQTSSTPIPDLRSGLHTPPPNQQPFTGEINYEWIHCS